MFVEVDFDSDEPLYLQIRNQIIKGIASGELEREESLPSVRNFAEDLGINLHTVNKAYTKLKQDGFITVNRKKGVVVNKEMPDADNEFFKNLENNLKPFIYEALCRGVKEDKFISICNKIFKEVN